MKNFHNKRELHSKMINCILISSLLIIIFNRWSNIYMGDNFRIQNPSNVKIEVEYLLRTGSQIWTWSKNSDYGT